MLFKFASLMGPIHPDYDNDSVVRIQYQQSWCWCDELWYSLDWWYCNFYDTMYKRIIWLWDNNIPFTFVLSNPDYDFYIHNLMINIPDENNAMYYKLTWDDIDE